MQYNAFRCLRDSGFEPVQFALSSRDLSPAVERGLLEYVKFERSFPAEDGVGILAFGEKDRGWSGGIPLIVQPGFQIKAQAVVFAPALLGAGLMIWTFKKRKPSG
jgi:hypothetical protein